MKLLSITLVGATFAAIAVADPVLHPLEQINLFEHDELVDGLFARGSNETHTVCYDSHVEKASGHFKW